MIVTKEWYSYVGSVPRKLHFLVLLFGFLPVWYSVSEV